LRNRLVVFGARRSAQRQRPSTVDPLRSAIMRAVRQRRTGGELVVRRLFRSIGYAARYNVKSMPGSPDLVTADGRLAIFVHGCFWHRHNGCGRTTTPKRNRAFWLAKFRANMERDRRKSRALRSSGVDVLVIWECETKSPEKLVAKLARALGRQGGQLTTTLRQRLSHAQRLFRQPSEVRQRSKQRLRRERASGTIQSRR
jgi:DNA mismatch endonuclease (patch repair protein)